MNTNFTKNPIVGTPLTPSVIKQIHTAVRRYMPIAGNGIRTSVTAGGTIISAIPAPAPKKQKDKPLPFEVRYDGTLDSGAGAWVIWLPDLEKLVQLDSAYLTITGVTAVTELPTGWYTIDELVPDTQEEVWCNIHIPNTWPVATATVHINDYAESAETNEWVINVQVAQMTETANGAKLVKQLVDSLITESSAPPNGAPIGYSYQDITVVTDVEYDTYAHTFKKKTRTIRALVPRGGAETTSNVFVAVPHVGA